MTTIRKDSTINSLNISKELGYGWLSDLDYEYLLVEIETIDGKFLASVTHENGADKLLVELPHQVEIESLVLRKAHLSNLDDVLTKISSEFERNFPQNLGGKTTSRDRDGVDDMSLDSLSYDWEDRASGEKSVLVIRWNGLLVAHVRREGERDDLVVEFPGPDAPEDRIVRKIRVKVFQHALKTAAAMFRDK